MATTLREVIESGGYNLNLEEDANWLLSKQSEFEELIEQAQTLVDDMEFTRDQASGDE